jgi:hypothetical protein
MAPNAARLSAVKQALFDERVQLNACGQVEFMLKTPW